MLTDLYVYINDESKRSSIINKVRGKEQEEYIRRAKELWRPYQPSPRSHEKTIGIDSSWNYKEFRGFYLLAVAGIAISDEGEVVGKEVSVEAGLPLIEEGGSQYPDPDLYLESMGMEYEAKLVESSADLGRVLVDGSIIRRFYDRANRRKILYAEYLRNVLKRSGTVFVSKSSVSRELVRGIWSDIYYFQKADSSPGFSESESIPSLNVSYFYARLVDHGPVLRIEIVGGHIDEKEIQDLMDVLYSRQFKGYPYALRLAHERCTITNKDIDALVRDLGLHVEVLARDVLEA
ncbi:MAG: DNA double-strand break repair nuclease NurA [Nitrososphaeria archaeon]